MHDSRHLEVIAPSHSTKEFAASRLWRSTAMDGRRPARDRPVAGIACALAVFLSGALAAPGARAQKPGTITTIAGTGEQAFAGDNGPALQAKFSVVTFLAMDRAGSLYLLDGSGGRIRRIDTGGTIRTVAGGKGVGYSGDGGKATDAEIYYASAITLDAKGNLYIADTSNHRIRRVTQDGTITTVAGSGKPGFLGDGGKATDAQMIAPAGVAVDAEGNLFISDTGNDRIRKVDPKGIISTYAGSGDVDLQGQSGFSGDKGSAAAAQLNKPTALAVDAKGALYLLDSGNRRIRRITRDGIITTVAGNGKSGGDLGDGGSATDISLVTPGQLTVDAASNLYFTDSYWGRVRRVGLDGKIATVAGGGNLGDGRPAVSAQLNPNAIAVDAVGNLLISEATRIREVFAVGAPGLVGGLSFPVATIAMVPGDVNGDRVVTVADSTLALLASVGLVTLTPQQQAAADVNFDGTVNIQDAVLILRAALGL